MNRHPSSQPGSNQRLLALWTIAGTLLCLSLPPALVAQQSAPAPEHAVDPFTNSEMRQAVSMADHGNKQQALDLAAAILQAHPDFVPALKLQGTILEDDGRMVEAADAYQKALKLAPNDPELLLKVGIYQLVAGDKEQAVTLLTHHLKLVPRDGDALYYLSQAYHFTGRDDLALKAIQECVKLQPENPQAWEKYGELLCSSGNCEDGLTWLKKAEHADPTLPRLDFALGVANLRTMNFADAESYAAKAAAAQPNDPSSLALLGSVEVKLSKWQPAHEALQRALALRPNDLPSLLEFGHSQLELGNAQDAVTTLQHVLELDPTQIIAHFYLSRAYAALGNTAEAQHQAELHHKMMDQMSLVPSFESSGRDQSIWPQAKKFLSGHRADQARALFLETFKGQSVTLANAYVFTGKLYLYMDNEPAGVSDLRRALTIDPKVRGAHTYLGILALKHADFQKAEAEFQAELANDPNYQTAIAEMGEVRYRQGRWADAVQQLEKSKTMVPTLLLMLCDSYFHLGKTHEADLTAETVAAWGRGEPDVMRSLSDLLNQNGQQQLAQRLAANPIP